MPRKHLLPELLGFGVCCKNIVKCWNLIEEMRAIERDERVSLQAFPCGASSHNIFLRHHFQLFLELNRKAKCGRGGVLLSPLFSQNVLTEEEEDSIAHVLGCVHRS